MGRPRTAKEALRKSFRELKEYRLAETTRRLKMKSFIETMFDILDDLSDGTDKEVIAELEKAGIDIEKAKKSFLETIKECKSKRRKPL
ncbi:MAG: hypothetical protein ACYTFK_13885 [Planctomycetota bacterium]|jgi:hypothetical protein